MRITVFLSYAHADRKTVDVIEDLLRRHGIGCWIDHRGIRLGERFDVEIERAIVRSGAVVWVVSSESVQNNYVKYEVTTALNHGRPVLPVPLEPIDLLRLPAPLNLKLGSVQAWDYFASPPEDLGARLADGLRRLVLRDRRKALVRLARQPPRSAWPAPRACGGSPRTAGQAQRPRRRPARSRRV